MIKTVSYHPGALMTISMMRFAKVATVDAIAVQRARIANKRLQPKSRPMSMEVECNPQSAVGESISEKWDDEHDQKVD